MWIFFFEKNCIRTGSGYLFDFYKEIFLRVIQDVTNDGGSVFFTMVFILSVCATLIAINGNSCYFIVNFFRPSGSSKLLLYCHRRTRRGGGRPPGLEKFQGKLCFQGNRKLLKNLE